MGFFKRPCFRCLLLFCALGFAVEQTSAQNVGGFILGKIQNFQQTSSAPPITDSMQPFQFGSLITMGTATINSAMATFSGTASPRSYTPVGNGDFSILDTFTTQAQLDSAYGTGTYNLSIDTSAGTFSRSIFLFPFSYPTMPMLTVPAGNWQSGMVVIDSAADYMFTWNNFSNAQPADMIELIVGTSTYGPFPASQTSFTLTADMLQPGMIYSCDIAFIRIAGASGGDPNIGPGYAVLVKNTEFTLRTLMPALALTSALSRKTHGSAGVFDVDLPLSGTAGIECRTGGAGANHEIVITFTNNIVSGNATVTSGMGNAGPPVFSGNTMIVDLTGVANAQTLTLTLSNVTDEFSQTLPDTAFNISFLLGDTNGNGAVNASDVSQTKARIGQTLDATNFRNDVNVNGTINATDAALVKSAVGTGLP